jgi:MATE family multidrug resistance protein
MIIARPIQLSLGLRAAGSDARLVRSRIDFLRWRSEFMTLLLAASPIVFIGLLSMAMSIIDIITLGRYDADGLATVVVVSDLYSIILNFSAGFAGVVTPRVATAIGAGVRWHVCTIVRRTLLLVLLLGAVGASILIFSGRILDVLGIKHSPVAESYASFMAGTYLFMLLFALGRAVLSAMGRPRFAVLAIVAALPLKAAANHVFINGAWGVPEMGVAGAGLASLMVALLMGGSLTLYLLVSPSFAEFDDPEPIPLTLLELWQLARPGVAMGLVAVSETGVFLASTLVVGIFAREDLLAHVLAFRSIAICYLFVASIGQAATIRLAFLHGSASRSLQVHANRAIATCSIILVALALVVLILGAAPLSQLLGSTVEAEADLTNRIAVLLRIAGLTLAALIPAHIITALLRALGDVGAPTAFTMASYWVLGLTVMLLLSTAGFGAQGVWLSLFLGASVCSLCSAAYLWRGRRSR